MKAGEPVYFTAGVEVPAHSGQLTFAEWSFEGETDFSIKEEFTNVSGDGTNWSPPAF